MLSAVDLKRQFDDFVDATRDSRQEAERDRDYIDHKQWTAQQESALKARGQAAVVINRIKPKHDFLLGLERQSRTDPKAYPRTPQHESDSEAVTDSLRYVADTENFDQTGSNVFDHVCGEGYGAAIVEVDESNEIAIRQIPWDRFYYDPHSRKRDFSDATFMGITTWLYLDEAIEMFPDAEASLRKVGESQASEDQTFEDKPMWLDRKHVSRPRVRVNEHYYKYKGAWHVAFFSFDQVLRESEESPYLSDEGKPICPIEGQSAYVDRDGNRYGVYRGLIHIQNEINHRRSKALHMLSSVEVIAGKGVVKSADRTLNQLASGKAFIELQNPEGRFEVSRNQELSQGQLLMLQEAKSEIDAVGVNSTLAGKDERSLSGRAIQAKQAGGAVELNHLLDGHNDWKRRIYRQVWARIRQFWTEERWVRVTDDESNVRFVGLNRRITGRDVLAEQLGVQPEGVEFALAQQGVPLAPGQADRVIGIENEVSRIDVDIIIAESADTVTLQQETFEQLVQLAQAYGPENVPFEDILRVSPLKPSVKEDLLRSREGGLEAAQQARQIAQQQAIEANELEKQAQMADIAETLSKARKNNADADETQREAQLSLIQPGAF